MPNNLATIIAAGIRISPSVEADGDRFKISGASGQVWEVTRIDGRYYCTCPYFQFRKLVIGSTVVCKHVVAAAYAAGGADELRRALTAISDVPVFAYRRPR